MPGRTPINPSRYGLTGYAGLSQPPWNRQCPRGVVLREPGVQKSNFRPSRTGRKVKPVSSDLRYVCGRAAGILHIRYTSSSRAGVFFGVWKESKGKKTPHGGWRSWCQGRGTHLLVDRDLGPSHIDIIVKQFHPVLSQQSLHLVPGQGSLRSVLSWMSHN